MLRRALGIILLAAVPFALGCEGPDDSHSDGGHSDGGHSDGGHSDGGHSDGGHSHGHDDHDDHDDDKEGHEGHGHEGHGHEGHDHDSTGPHGGHILELGEEEYHIEWTHDDDSGTVTIYVLDAEMKKVVKADSAKISTKIKEPKNYDLEPVEQDGDSFFELKDGSLLATLSTVGEGVSATIEVVIDGKTFTQAFTEHSGHKH